MKKSSFAKLPICTLRVLQAQFKVNDEMGFTTWDHLADQVRAQFKKSYTKDLIIESCNTLIQHELLEQAGTGIGATYSITKKGRAVVKEINGLAVKSPDPWRKFTRESYSQNVAV